MRKLIGAASCWVVLDDVAKAPHCLDNWAAIWEWLLEFAPEIVDKNLDIIWQDISIEVPNVSHNVIFAEDLILVAQEVLTLSGSCAGSALGQSHHLRHAR